MKHVLPLVLGLAVLGTGCTFPSSSRVVSPRQVGRVQPVEYGVVERAEKVVIAGRRTHLGTLGGGAIGAAATSEVGHGAGRDLARAGGAVAGAVVGQAVEEAVTRTAAQELLIRMDSGKVVVITQPAPPEFRTGERVAVLAGGGGGARVTYP